MAVERRRFRAIHAVASVVVVVLILLVVPTRCDTTTPAVEIRRGPTTRRTVALTFDAGSDRGYATSILNTLKAQHVPAAFGMTGVWASANGDLVRRMAAEGHLLMNHTYDHKSFTGYSTGTAALTTSQRLSELSRAESAVAAVGGPKMKPFFRAPYGDTNAGVNKDVGSVGYGWSILWTVDSLGWKGLSAQAIIDRCAKGAVNGAIYLFHVGSASQDAAALPGLITRFRASGWTFTRVDKLIGA